jgi:hypothetical protein
MVCDHHRGQHPSEPLNSHEERNLVMRHEPIGSCPPLKPSLTSAAGLTGAVESRTTCLRRYQLVRRLLGACRRPNPRSYFAVGSAEAHASRGVLVRCLSSVAILEGFPTNLVISR